MRIFIVIVSLNVFSMDFQSAKLLYDLNSTSFSKKEISTNLSLCVFQNKLAAIIRCESYSCSRDDDDTHKGDEKLNSMEGEYLDKSAYIENVSVKMDDYK